MCVFGAVPEVGKQALFCNFATFQTMKFNRNQGFLLRYWMQTLNDKIAHSFSFENVAVF